MTQSSNNISLSTGATQLPKFNLFNQHGVEVSDSDFSGKSVLIYVYPKDRTPGCTTQTKAYGNLLSSFKELGVNILGISKDSVASHKKFADIYNIDFDLLSDPNMELIKALGAAKMSGLLSSTFLGIIRSSFVFGKDGELLKAQYKVSAKEDAGSNLEFCKNALPL